MELSVYNIAGQETGRKVALNEAIFGVEPNEHAIYLDVKQYLANQRQGTHKSKERGEISGSTAKLKKQKGTGTARSGSIKSPVFRGGGRVFGPRPRNYGFKLNKKLKQLARKSALAIKASNNKISIVEDFNLEAPKTKQIVEIFNNMKVEERRVLIVLNEANENVVLSSRNLKNVDVVEVKDLSTYAIMKASSVMFFETSVQGLDEMFKLN
ncbi:MAG: 50S ribosomal protein L4 [Marinifilaceae bacterium]|jgi:large subunit ribosomal protein L4|nr:50S ribosomal protein L4 [Marinilabiliaceae bacterium JC040]MCT4600675.1 50S ribosomal protein L4 [Marinifilaceae bacterium]